MASSTQRIEAFNPPTFSAGQTIANGQLLDGVTYTRFNLTGGATTGYITNQANSFSSGLSLAANHPGNPFFFGGEGFQLTFATPIKAFGIFFNANLNSGTFGFTTPVLSAMTGSTSYDNNTFVFAGLIASNPFQTLTVSSTGALAYYTVPSFISVNSTAAIPEPSSYLLCLAGFSAVLFLSARRAFRTA